MPPRTRVELCIATTKIFLFRGGSGAARARRFCSSLGLAMGTDASRWANLLSTRSSRYRCVRLSRSAQRTEGCEEKKASHWLEVVMKTAQVMWLRIRLSG